MTAQSEIRNNIYVAASNWFVNRCPLVARVPRVPIGSTTFTMIAREGSRTKGFAQYCQTFQHPVQAGGSLGRAPGAPFEESKMDALQNLVDEMEFSSYYGEGSDPATETRPKQKGLRTLIANVAKRYMGGAAYSITDFIGDTLQPCRANSGDADVLLVSPDFMTRFAAWGHTPTRIDAGVNVFGAPIDVYEVAFLGGVSIIEAPLLKPATAIALTSSEVRMRMKRNEFWNPRGVRGDAYEGEWMAEGAIELDNPAHHAWLEGITEATP